MVTAYQYHERTGMFDPENWSSDDLKPVLQDAVSFIYTSADNYLL